MSIPTKNEKAAGDHSHGAFPNKTLYDKARFDREEGRRQLDSAKERVGVVEGCVALGLEPPRGKVGHSPLRNDKHPSFSVSNNKVWHDFATGEGGDVVTLIERATGCTTGEAISKLIEIAGGSSAKLTIPRARETKKPVTRKPLKVPDFEAPSIPALAQIQRVRGWPTFAGLELARQRENLFLCVGTDNGESRTAYALTDKARKSIQLRPLDGTPWKWNDAKAWTLGGSAAGWPIGAANIGDCPIVAFCEGGPDFLAALTLAFLHGIHDQVGVVFMPGATAAIVPDALQLFAGKRVRIFEHADKAGAAAGPRWAEQLTAAGAIVDGFTLEAPHKDLADLLAAVDAETLEPAVNIFAGLTEGVACL